MIGRKEFEAVAEEIKNINPEDSVLTAICRAFAELNPRFDKEKFLKACGVGV